MSLARRSLPALVNNKTLLPPPSRLVNQPLLPRRGRSSSAIAIVNTPPPPQKSVIIFYSRRNAECSETTMARRRPLRERERAGQTRAQRVRSRLSNARSPLCACVSMTPGEGAGARSGSPRCIAKQHERAAPRTRSNQPPRGRGKKTGHPATTVLTVINGV
jgi:hypothetical protein